MHCHFSHKQSKHETNREKERERETGTRKQCE